MLDVEPNVPADAVDYRELPELIPPEETIATQETREAPDPTMGRDTETEFLLRNAAG